MPHRQHLLSLKHTGCLLLAVLAFSLEASAEWKEKVLYSFQGGSDGSTPAGGVVLDSAGNLYGANIAGGIGGSGCPSGGCGVVFELFPPRQKGGSWTETTIYSFQGFNQGNDGFSPYGGLIIDAKGNLYGTTAYGGTGSCTLLGGTSGCGIVYELSPPKQKGGKWTYMILYSFQGGKDGYFAWGDLVFDSKGNLYGATRFGGGKGTSCNILYGGQCGTVFELRPPTQKGGKWKEKVLHHFAGGTKGEQSSDGAEPNGGLVVDSHGVVYGTTFFGGNNAGQCDGGVGGIGCGTVFALDPPARKGGAWKEEKLHVFEDGNDSTNPAAGLTLDTRGNLFGATIGTVFSLTALRAQAGAWKEAILYEFNSEAWGPQDTLIFDKSGDLCGTTYSSQEFSGTAFCLKPAGRNDGFWSFNLLYGFSGGSDGAKPTASLVAEMSGSFYGTTTEGGTGSGCSFQGCGVVFELSP